MNPRYLVSLSTALGLATSASASVTVINMGLQSGMSVPPGVTLNSLMTSNNTGDQPTNLALSTTTGAASGLSLTA
ncbi:MAG: hypothetical protein KDN05_15065, partial [Verrucomicrobiae bacterium]|nr:hypothetical protein [Verrucomicrobiae bacterium]